MAVETLISIAAWAMCDGSQRATRSRRDAVTRNACAEPRRSGGPSIGGAGAFDRIQRIIDKGLATVE
jgi:hypothetical protein